VSEWWVKGEEKMRREEKSGERKVTGWNQG
jgi:hypothetical protein